MAILEVLTFPNPLLRQKGRDVQQFDAALAALADDMLETMYHRRGIGLAAIQVGRQINLVVTDFKTAEEESVPREPKAWVNPRITGRGGVTTVTEEGCLSVPDFRADVRRDNRITVEYQNLQGQPQTETLEGLEAIVLQHELDHLNGKLFIDRLSPIKRELVKKRLLKQERSA